MRRPVISGPIFLAVLLLVLALVAAASAPHEAAAAKTKKVTIAGSAFSPKTITVTKGTKVTWKNLDGIPHNVVSASSLSTSATTTGLFASPTLTTGKTWSYTFKKKGTYFYLCTFHAGMASMHGKVVVK